VPKLRFPLIVLAAAFCLAGAGPPIGNAATPCWQRVIDDWLHHNGGITGHYSPLCLRQAMGHVPEDLRAYSPILDDINAALISAVAPRNRSGRETPVPSSGTSNPTTRNSKAVAAATAADRAREAAKIVPHAGTLGSVPGGSRSIPLPLILLAAVLLAAGLAASGPPLFHRLRNQ
jgi:hypothetical protein